MKELTIISNNKLFPEEKIIILVIWFCHASRMIMNILVLFKVQNSQQSIMLRLNLDKRI